MTWKDKFPEENRYYETENGILYCGDCMEIMGFIEGGTIDLVLTDPPYNIACENKLTKRNGSIKNTQEAWGSNFKDKWGSIEEYSKWLLEWARLAKDTMKDEGSFISFFDRTYLGYFVYVLENKLNLIFRNKLYFIKNNPLPHFRKNNYRSCVEEAIWMSKSKKYNINFISQKEMRQTFFGNIGSRYTKHPTEKYIWMLEPIIIRHTNENDIILDPFAGSGTTAIACEKLNRRWICIEINKEYCKTIKQRIEEYINQKGSYYDYR